MVAEKVTLPPLLAHSRNRIWNIVRSWPPHPSNRAHACARLEGCGQATQENTTLWLLDPSPRCRENKGRKTSMFNFSFPLHPITAPARTNVSLRTIRAYVRSGRGILRGSEISGLHSHVSFQRMPFTPTRPCACEHHSK